MRQDDRNRAWVVTGIVCATAASNVSGDGTLPLGQHYGVSVPDDDGDVEVWGVTQDISPGGIGFMSPVSFATGAAVSLNVSLPGHRSRNALLAGTVEHSSPTHGGWVVGVRLEQDVDAAGNGGRAELLEWLAEVLHHADHPQPGERR